MGELLKNIIENIALDFLNKALETRQDICTCQICRNDMMAYVLCHVPAKYVTTEKGALYTIIAQTRVEKEAEVGRAVLNAIETVSKHPRHEISADQDQAFQLLLDKIYEDRGLDFRHYHHELLKRRLTIRMRLNKVETLSDYMMILINNAHEYDKLFEVLCINVSEFYRDPDVWVVARKLIEDLIKLKVKENEKNLIIWSAACAYGEEPYSIAIMIKDILRSIDAKSLKIDIYATDIDPKALRACQKAEYPKTGLRNVKEEHLKLYFSPVFGGNYKLSEEIKKMVTFSTLDLIASDFIKNTDVVFCRNVFIYFTRSLQDQLLMKFYKSLKNGGYLILGKTETMWQEAQSIFGEVDGTERIYKKKQVT